MAKFVVEPILSVACRMIENEKKKEVVVQVCRVRMHTHTHTQIYSVRTIPTIIHTTNSLRQNEREANRKRFIRKFSQQ